MENMDLAAMLTIAGELSVKPANWNKETPLRKWTGVKCGKADGAERVKELRIAACQGKLSPRIGGLTSLRHLEISGCSFNAPLPSELSELTELRELFIAKNVFPNPLPDIWENLQNLTALAVAHNPGQEKTRLPASAGSLKKLVYLDLAGLDGENLEEDLAQLRKLEFLRLSGMRLKEIPSWVYAQRKLSRLYLSLNPLQAVSGRLCMLSDLTVLDLSACGLTVEQLPECLAKLPGLAQLALAGNPLGTLPVWLKELKALSVLALQGTGLGGGFPEDLFALPHLSMLNLAGNKLSGPIPGQASQWRYWTSLTDLDLSHNDFSGSIPDVFDKTSILFRLHVVGTRLTGPVPSSLKAAGTRRRVVGLDWREKLENPHGVMQ